jgi:hypothetical protein
MAGRGDRALSGLGARLYPGGLATPTPRHSAWSPGQPFGTPRKFPPQRETAGRTAPGPYPPDLSRCQGQGRNNASSSRTTFRHARRPAGPGPQGHRKRRQEQGDTQLGQGEEPGCQRPRPHPCRHRGTVRDGKRQVSHARIRLRPRAFSEASDTSPAATTGISLIFPGTGSEFPVCHEQNTRTASRIPGIAVRVPRLYAYAGHRGFRLRQ